MDYATELDSIIKELRDISDGVRRDFSGIGEHYCANSLVDVIGRCEAMKKTLKKMDLDGPKQGKD